MKNRFHFQKSVYSLLASLCLLAACEQKEIVPRDASPASSAAGRKAPKPADVPLCPAGQSPINIVFSQAVRLQGQPLVMHYESFPLTSLRNLGANLLVMNTGNNYITIGKERYNLLQFHFHRNSEHALNGRKGAMEVHLVHANAAGNLAVLGSVIELGRYSGSLDLLFRNSPGEEGEVSLDASFDPALLVPKAGRYFTYSGSLTTPPFSESVRWLVFQHPLQISAGQLQQYAQTYPALSARPLQPLGNRTLYFAAGRFDHQPM